MTKIDVSYAHQLFIFTLGLPLNLAVNGTTTVQLKSKTDFNVRNMFSTGDALLEAKIYPSGTVQVISF